MGAAFGHKSQSTGQARPKLDREHKCEEELSCAHVYVLPPSTYDVSTHVAVGDSVGRLVGVVDSMRVGEADGDADGLALGAVDGLAVGVVVSVHVCPLCLSRFQSHPAVHL